VRGDIDANHSHGLLRYQMWTASDHRLVFTLGLNTSGGGRPRLKLAPRTKPLPVMETAPEPKVPEKEPEPEPAPLPSGPPKPRANPFGAARPREEVLKEKGVDPVAADKEPERQAPDE